MRYAIVIEKAKRNYSAFVPDVPGCVATGDTLNEVRQMMKEALEFHFEGMLLDGEAVPEPTSECCYVNVNMARVEREICKQTRTSSH